jgi:hypothetical protein
MVTMTYDGVSVHAVRGEWQGRSWSRSAEQMIRMATSFAAEEGHCGAIALSRSGDPALGDFEDAVILKAIGEVDVAVLSA